MGQDRTGTLGQDRTGTPGKVKNRVYNHKGRGAKVSRIAFCGVEIGPGRPDKIGPGHPDKIGPGHPDKIGPGHPDKIGPGHPGADRPRRCT
jgi:hypothetical protein